MEKSKFCTSIACMDGRIQIPITSWLKKNYGVDYVDTITEPGMDKLFHNPSKVEEIKSKALISVNAHGSKIILVSGHHDCAGNPITKKEHLIQIKEAVSIIDSWNLSVRVIGGWINEKWELEIL